MRDQQQLYIDGAWVPSTGTGTIDVIDASTEQVIGRIPEGTAADVDAAVAAAKAAFPAWAATSRDDRAKVLQALAEGLAARSEEIAEVISREVGMPLFYATLIQAGLPANNMAKHVEMLSSFAFEERIGNSLIVREPVGVVGAITPWNYPLHQIVCKVAPALAAGNTVVLKPSEVAPLNAFILAEIIDDAGLPAGVFNLVTGVGPVVGEAIAAHPDVDMVSFTGSTRAGKRVSELGAQTVKRVHLELGGKSANIILDDADLERAIPPGVQFGCYLNSGQTCSALTRMLVPRDLQDRVVELAVAKAESLKVGPADSGADLGPLISATQRDRVRGYIQQGIDEGARLVTGGPEAPEGLDTGYFVQPTIFADVTADMTIAQEEIFGPVLCILPYDSEDEAVEIANSTVYGLAGGVQSGDQERALAVARRLRTGQVEVNGGAYNIEAPFGGYKQSGNGRELGPFGLEEFCEVKAIQLPA
ncbi:MAG: aldehyde dehydrogenase family protein [Acidimicrobiales bacterium]